VLRRPRFVGQVSGVRSEQDVEAALAGMATVDRHAAEAARAAYGSLTFGEGPQVITGHAVADFLWYQLPVKWLCDLAEKLTIAAALGELLSRLSLLRYAAMCNADTTAEVIAAYEHDRTAGVKAYRAALAASGVQPPDLPGVLQWAPVMGPEETAAYFSASVALEAEIEAGTLQPGRSGWRRRAAQITEAFLHSSHDDTTGSSWLQWVHTERLQHFADSRSPARARLAAPLADRLVNPEPVPADADQVLAPMRWLLDHAAEGAALTTTGNLARPLVAEGCRRFDWLTLTGNPRSESDIVELWTLRDWAGQMAVVRRSGRRLVLSTIGRTVHGGGTAALWHATMNALCGPGDADAAAAETALMLLLTDDNLDYTDLNAAVAQALAGEGWRQQSTGQPVTGDQVATLVASLRRRLRLLGLTTQERLGQATRLTPTGRAAAHTAVRARALRPRQHPLE
jgi:hypothetical protein